MIRVAVADDQSLVRLGVGVLVETEDDLALVGSAEDGQQAVDLARRERPDVFLMDIRMPVKDGLSALRDIVADPACSTTKVIMLTTFELDEYVFEALRGGASGFLIKDGEPAELLHAIRVVADGGSLLASSVTRKLIEEFTSQQPNRPNPHPRLDSLTAREREIVGWVGTGRSNDEIAAELVVSPATVRTHVGRSMLKLGARDRAQLVVFAYQSGLAR
ncbi:MAG: response regulator transcription factor [Geodermatophilaceae bacterium]|nr:response regulator transcription factor [Geodermatophilaceae bacterium]